MNKLAILVFFLLMSNFCIAQTFDLNELIRMSSMKFEQFDIYILNKGYEFHKAGQNNEYESRSYAFGRIKKNIKYATSFINIYRYSNGEKMVSLEIIDKNQYLKIKDELQNNGFALYKTYSSNGAAITEYKKGKLKATLVSSIGENSYGETLSNYEIAISKGVD